VFKRARVFYAFFFFFLFIILSVLRVFFTSLPRVFSLSKIFQKQHKKGKSKFPVTSPSRKRERERERAKESRATERKRALNFAFQTRFASPVCSASVSFFEFVL
jgi:hypothetical protein